jgi:hypothetical protein
MGVLEVQLWLKKAVLAQPVHRDDLAAEGTAGGIMHRSGITAATLQAAPHLAQQLTQEQALVRTRELQNVPRMGPPTLGPGSAPGAGLSNLNMNLQPRPPRGSDDSK